MKDLKIFATQVEQEALDQIELLLAQPAFADCKVRIMPDVHAGAGCVIGFTADLGDKVIPNVVGVDIGCGMLTTEFTGKLNLPFLDAVIRNMIPSGMKVRDHALFCYEGLERLYCKSQIRNDGYFERSIGTLGGGNHFIEVDTDGNGRKYLVIHSGSRNLGVQVAKYYQNLAIKNRDKYTEMYLRESKERVIRDLKNSGRQNMISHALARLKEINKEYEVPDQLCFLTGEERQMYLHDMQICQNYASINRDAIADIIIRMMEWEVVDRFETIHNYIDLGTNIVRKGAVSAKKGEKILIPLNMRDGSLICIGKGNDDWNQSAPHGAGRLMSRRAAKENLSMEDYHEEMRGIFTTSVSRDTLDEAPGAYKPWDAIVPLLADTVDVRKPIRPIHNFKAGE